MSTPSLARTAAFVFLIPLSTDSADAVKLRVNRRLLQGEEVLDTVGPPSSHRKRQYVIRLDYTLLFGRSGLSFGWSRFNEFKFPQVDDIAKQHFVLHFEMHTGTLLLTDTSPDGTWVFDTSAREFKLLYHATFLLLEITEIRIGHGNRYRFRIEVVEHMKERVGFAEMFREYAQSIGEPTSAFVKRVSISHMLWVSSNDIPANLPERKRRCSITLLKDMLSVKRLKMIVDPPVVRRKSQSDGVRMADQRVNSLKAFEIISWKSTRGL